MEFPKTDRRVVIASKGPPFIDRQKLSLRIARWAKSPIFSMHAILKLLSEENGYGNLGLVPSEAEAERLYRLAFSILCTMAKTNLYSSGPFFHSQMNCVVVESPLSSTCQLQQLLDHFHDAWIIIIECRATSKHRWRMRFFEERELPWFLMDDDLLGEDTGSTKMWFAPKNWEDAEKAIEQYDAQAWDDYFHLKCSDNPYLRRLVMDPKRDLGYFELEEGKERASPFIEVLRYIFTSKEARSVIELGQWHKEHMERVASLCFSPNEKSSDLCKNGDCLFRYEDHLDYKAICMACDEELTHHAYTCQFCTLALHKSCAETRPYKPKFLYIDGPYGLRGGSLPWLRDRCKFPKVHACKSCEVFSYDCTTCILKTHLKCRMMPTIVKADDCHEHILSIRLTLKHTNEHGCYYCQACGEEGAMCSYFCIFCRFNYHVRCVTSPRELEHQHGGFNHFMKLKSSHEKVEEDCWCDVCCKDVDPECWFYSCQQCPYYIAHLHCVFVKSEHKIYLPSDHDRTTQ